MLYYCVCIKIVKNQNNQKLKLMVEVIGYVKYFNTPLQMRALWARIVDATSDGHGPGWAGSVPVPVSFGT